MKNFYFRRYIIRLLFSSLAFLFIFSSKLTAQPTPCSTPTPGLPFGGDFSIGGSNPVFSDATGDFYTCIPPGASTIAVTTFPANSNNQSYIWDVQNSTNFLTGFPSSFVTSHVYSTEGVYYIAQKDVVFSQVTCKKLTIFKNNISISGIEIKLCGTKKVELKIPSKTTNPTNNHSRYVITWADGIIETVIPNATDYVAIHNYVSATDAANAVKVKGEYIDNSNNVICASNEGNYTPNPSNNIILNSLTTLSDKKSFDLTFTGFVASTNYQVSYAKDDGNFSWSTYPTNAQNGQITMSGNMFNTNSTYCFKIKYVDNCGVSQESNVVCSINLNENLTSTSSVNLNWNLPTIPNGILVSNDLIKLTTPGGTNNLLLPSTTTNTFTDNTLNCANTYEFWITNVYNQVQADGTSNNITIKSNTVNVSPISVSSPPASQLPLVVSYNSNTSVFVNVAEQVQLHPEYIFYRADNNSSTFTQISKGPNNSFTDNSVQAQNNYYCYKFAYTDACGKTSALSDPYCTVFLDSKSQNTLNWTPYVVPNTSGATVFYKILLLDNMGNFNPVYNTFNTQEDVLIFINSSGQQQVTFQIVAYQNPTDVNGNLLPLYSYSNTYTFNIPPTFFIPTAFSPNNDGKNDNFIPLSKFVTSGEMIIFDRWGNIIFKTTNLVEGWDGMINGKEAPIGTYTYQITAVGVSGNEISKTGVVTLLR